MLNLHVYAFWYRQVLSPEHTNKSCASNFATVKSGKNGRWLVSDQKKFRPDKNNVRILGLSNPKTGQPLSQKAGMHDHLIGY